MRRSFLISVAILCLCSASPRTNPGAASPVVPFKALPLPLADVRLTGGPLKAAQDRDAQYLLALEPNRMMAFLRKAAGLQPKAEGYGGWDGPDRQLTGHIAGHYLSGVSLMWAATGDPRFKERADYLVKELKEVQDKQGDGYIGAQSDKNGVDGKVLFQQVAKGDIRSASFDLNGMWSPWYVLHKIFAGLRDAYRYTGNRTALDVETRFAAWAETIVGKLDEQQVQKMLGTEFGGMNEVLVDLYADTSDKRWLALSDRFEHHAIVDPLSRRQDILAGKHGNTLVPKLFGSLVRYMYTGNQADGTAASFFWDQVALHHSFATGGHGRNEYFGEADKLNDMIEGRTAETCNVYNMIKMARQLFALNPDMRYADFHERALFNHILGSMDPADGAVCYMVPVGQRVSREYQDMAHDFTCCVGSALESHALHADGLYYQSGDKLWVNIYAPSTATFRNAGAQLTMSTTFPEGEDASLSLKLDAPRLFTLALRRPYWATRGFSVKVNGRSIADVPRAGNFVNIRRTWKNGDTVQLVLPKTLRLEPLRDNPNRVALMWGPLVLAGDLGEVQRRAPRAQGASRQPVPAPAIVTTSRAIADWVKPVAGKPGDFRTDGVGRESDVDLVPFYRLHRRLYAAYWDLLTPAEWQKREADLRLAEEKQKKLEAATVAFVRPQRGGKAFELVVDDAHAMALVVTYAGDERATRTFDVLVDGTKIGEQTIERRSPEKNTGFFDVEYSIPPDVVKGKQKIVVSLRAAGGNDVAAVYGLRVIRTDQPR